jgi:hypothetical protein
MADRLGMFYTYAANLDREPLNAGEPRCQYGTAILSNYSMTEIVLDRDEPFIMKKNNSTPFALAQGVFLGNPILHADSREER